MTDSAKLTGALHRGQVLVIVGAGLSIDASGGRPEASWIGLLRSGLTWLDGNEEHGKWVKAELARLGDADALRLSYFADELRERMSFGPEGSIAFDAWLSEAVRRIEDGYQSADAPKGLLDAVIGLACPLATTNYDQILEQRTGLKPITMDEEGDVAAFIRKDHKSILHLHGLPSRPTSVVLGRQSYDRYLSSSVQIELQRSLSTVCSCLFIGFGEGLRDLNFTPWFRWISATLRDSSIHHYVLLNAHDASVWRQDAHPTIKAISYGKSHADLPEFLRTLRASADAISGATKIVKDPYLPGMEEQRLWQKIEASRQGKEEIARTIHRYLEDKLADFELPKYAIKYRIKSLHSIWTKVQDIAAKTPLYQRLDAVDDVRDIIGIRIVTLYRLELKQVVKAVAEWLLKDSSTPFRARLEGVKIFGRDMMAQDDDSPLAIAAVLRKFFNDNLIPIESGPVPIASSYSAFHLLCTYVGDNGRRAMFEIQMRSALEDIWSEIEHGLRYKPVDQGVERGAREAAELRLARYHLHSLKTLIDGAAQYADTIRIHLDGLAPLDTSRVAKYTQDKSERLEELLNRSNASQLFLQQFKELFKHQTIFLGKIVDPNRPPGKDNEAAADNLTQLAKQFAELVSRAEGIALRPHSDRREVKLLIQMEEAFCLLEGTVRRAIKTERKPGLQAALSVYLRIQSQLDGIGNLSWTLAYRPVVLHRLARLRWHMDLVEDCIELSEKAFELVIADAGARPIAQDRRAINVEIALYLAWTLQDRAELLTIRSIEEVNPGYHREERRRIYARITQISLLSLARLDETNEALINFALFGAAEFAALGSAIWETTPPIASKSQIDHYIDLFNANAILQSNDTDAIHTLFRVAEHILRDIDLAKRAAKRLELVIAGIMEPDQYQKRDLAQARAWLEQHAGDRGRDD